MFLGFENVNLCAADENQLASFNRGYQYHFIRRFIPILAKEMGELFREHQFDIASSIYNTPTPSASCQKIVFFFGEEKPQTPRWLKRDYQLIFRQYLDQQTDPVILPMPLGIDDEFSEEMQRELGEREFNIFFSGNMNAHRVDLYRSVAGKSKPVNLRYWKRFLAHRYRKKMPQEFSLGSFRAFILFTDGFFKGLSQPEYLKMLCNSVCVICPKGFVSADTMRHYEAMKFGCVALSTAVPNNDFYRNSPHIVLKGWEEIPRVVTRLRSEPHELERLHQAARTWWRETGSEAAFARYVAAKISDRKPPNSGG